MRRVSCDYCVRSKLYLVGVEHVVVSRALLHKLRFFSLAQLEQFRRLRVCTKRDEAMAVFLPSTYCARLTVSYL